MAAAAGYFPSRLRGIALPTRTVKGNPFEKEPARTSPLPRWPSSFWSPHEGTGSEVAQLLADASVALAGARRKLEAGLSLSRAEWIVLAYYIQLGVETSMADPISPETMRGILQAFRAAYPGTPGKEGEPGCPLSFESPDSQQAGPAGSGC